MAYTYHKLFFFWPTHIIIYRKLFLESMNIIKNQMRNRMRNDRLNDCLVIYIAKDIFIDFQNKKTILSFHNMKNCRGQLSMIQIFLYGAPTIQKSWIRHCIFVTIYKEKQNFIKSSDKGRIPYRSFRAKNGYTITCFLF